MARLQRLFSEQNLTGLEVGSPQWFKAQHEIMRSRPLVRYHYERWYRAMLKDAKTAPGKGIIVELGAGGSFIKEIDRRVVTSDVIAGVADRVIDARKLPFKDESVRAILLTHTFHHIPDIERFLREAERVLVPGGVVCIIDAAATPLARLIFTHFHPEPFDAKARSWDFRSTHHMHSSNQALSWIVFARDRARFERLYPNLAIERIEYWPWMSYLASGGVTRKNLAPKFLHPILKGIDAIAQPFASLHTIIWGILLRKKGETTHAARKGRKRTPLRSPRRS